jgi:hypothetical protein
MLFVARHALTNNKRSNEQQALCGAVHLKKEEVYGQLGY